MARLRRFALLRTTFQLILASLSMTIAISYCTSLSRLLSDLDPENGGLALGFLFSIYLIASLFFSIFVEKWIQTNLKMVLFIYLTTALLFSFVDSIIIMGYFEPFTDFFVKLLGSFILWIFMFLPLISLVATPVQVISEILNSLKKKN